MSPSRSAEPESPDSPSPIPPPRSPLFKAPTTSPSPSQTSSSPSPEATPSPTLDPLDADEAAPSWSTDAPSAPDPSGAEPGDIRSTGRELRLSKAGLKAAVGTGFRQVCRAVAAFVADEEERALGVFTPDAEDVEDVARPAANIVYRRLPDQAKGGDVIDIMALGLALVGYLGKSLGRRAQLRTVRQLQEAQGITVDQAAEAGPHYSAGGGY